MGEDLIEAVNGIGDALHLMGIASKIEVRPSEVVVLATRSTRIDQGLTIRAEARRRAKAIRWVLEQNPDLTACLPPVTCIGFSDALVVPALCGRPGLRFHTYSPEKTPEANARLILAEMHGLVGVERRAVYTSHVHLIPPRHAGRTATSRGVSTRLASACGFILEEHQVTSIITAMDVFQLDPPR